MQSKTDKLVIGTGLALVGALLYSAFAEAHTPPAKPTPVPSAGTTQTPATHPSSGTSKGHVPAPTVNNKSTGKAALCPSGHCSTNGKGHHTMLGGNIGGVLGGGNNPILGGVLGGGKYPIQGGVFGSLPGPGSYATPSGGQFVVPPGSYPMLNGQHLGYFYVPPARTLNTPKQDGPFGPNGTFVGRGGGIESGFSVLGSIFGVPANGNNSNGGGLSLPGYYGGGG